MNFLQQLLKFFLNLFKAKPGNNSTKPQPARLPTTNTSKPSPSANKPVVEVPSVAKPEKEKLAVEAVKAPNKELQIEESQSGNKRMVKVTDGLMEASFRHYQKGSWKGWYTQGKHSVIDFINSHKAMLQGLDMTDSAINVMRAVSANEGKLEAINAYDGAFLSFGIFQWTLGTGTNKGELPALLKKLKSTYPASFEKYFGQFGLDIEASTNTTYGYFLLNGEKVQSKASKEKFRSPEWVYRFWRAGQDKEVQAAQIEHALSRLKNFYWRWKVQDIPFNELVTSEYGVGLILDNHVNLPLLVKLSLQQAMLKTSLGNPANWSDADEANLLAAYLKERAQSQPYTRKGQEKSTGPMHNANQRAATTRGFVEKNIISSARGSFQYSTILSRSIDSTVVDPPPGFFQEEYPEIEEGIGMEEGTEQGISERVYT